MCIRLQVNFHHPSQEVIVESRNYQERPRKDKKIDGRTISEELGNCHRSSR